MRDVFGRVLLGYGLFGKEADSGDHERAVGVLQIDQEEFFYSQFHFKDPIVFAYAQDPERLRQTKGLDPGRRRSSADLQVV